MDWHDVIRFWFEECSPSQWFRKDEAFDAKMRERFLKMHGMVARGETASWRTAPRGRLAEIIVLDQFSRNMFRGTPQSFSYDEQAHALAEEAIKAGDDRKLSGRERHFLYMPYMHSESRDAHKKAMRLFFSLPFKQWGAFLFEWKHKKIIDRFGRYPHRNAILGRTSTPEEIEFMRSHKSF